jgi:hypothetical protein
MNSHRRTRLRLTAAIAAAIGSIVLGGPTSAITTEAPPVAKAVRVAGQHTAAVRHVRNDNQAPCPEADSACSLAAALTPRNTAGGRVLYR